MAVITNMPVLCICDVCGTEFKTRPSYAKSGRKCCSKKCAHIHHSKVMTEKNAIIYIRPKKLCKNCGKEFTIKLSRDKKGYGVFCSKKCQGDWASKNTRGKNSWFWKGGLVIQECKKCNKKFLAKPSHIKKGLRKFCSKKCTFDYRSEFYRRENHPLWKGGSSSYSYPTGWKKEFKEKIRNRDKNRCFLCRKEETNKKLSVHHIDYDKNNLSPRNLISLCNKCHVRTNHNREHWITIFHDLLSNSGERLEI
jgi:hypothetical protein